MGYAKLFDSTFTGSMVGSGPVAFAVWAYLLAHTRADSRVEANPVLIAAAIGCDVDDVKDALTLLASPDAASRSKSHEGARILPETGFTYFVVNHSEYRGMRNDDERRAYNRRKKQESRERQREQSNDVNIYVNNGQPASTVVSPSQYPNIPISQDVLPRRDTPASLVPPTADPGGQGNGKSYQEAKPKPPAKPKRGPLAHFVPEDFKLKKAMVEWADKEVPGVDLYGETQKFRDCEFSKPRSDWHRAWKNWMRKAHEQRR